MTDSRGPLRSESSDTIPNAINGTIAAPARISVNRVAMCRMRRAISQSISTRDLRHVQRAPKAQRAQNIPTWFHGHVEPCADRSSALAPGQEDGGRIIENRTLQSRHARAIGRGICGVTNAVEGRIRFGIVVPTPVASAAGLPESIRLRQSRAHLGG